MGSRAGVQRGALPNDRHGHRRRCFNRRASSARTAASGNGTYPDSTSSRSRRIRGRLSLAWSITGADSEGPPGLITFTATSSNHDLLLDDDITFGPSIQLTERFIRCTPQLNATGTTLITVKVSDGSSETWRTFNLTVTPVNDAPAITPIPDMPRGRLPGSRRD